jgi:hypothetical protein
MILKEFKIKGEGDIRTGWRGDYTAAKKCINISNRYTEKS